MTATQSPTPREVVEPLLSAGARAYLADLVYAAELARHDIDAAELARRDPSLLTPQPGYDPNPFDFDEAAISPITWLARRKLDQVCATLHQAHETHARLAAAYVRAALHAVAQTRATHRVTPRDLENASVLDDAPVCSAGDGSVVPWRAELRPALPPLFDIQSAPGWSPDHLRSVYDEVADAYAAAHLVEQRRPDLRPGDTADADGDEERTDRATERDQHERQAATIPHLLIRLGKAVTLSAESWSTIHRYSQQRRIDRAAGRCVTCLLCEGCETLPGHRCGLSGPCICHLDAD